MDKSSPTAAPLQVAPPPRAVTSGPIRACPRWDPLSGTILEPGVTLSGLTFSTNRDIPHEVVLVDSSGNPVPGAVITPSILTPSGGPPTYTGTVSVMVPTGTAAGNYYLQVRIPAPDTAANYSHTIELVVAVGPVPTAPAVVILPTPGSEPGTYLVGTWVALDSVVTGGTPAFAYNWKLNGASGMGSMPGFSFQLVEGMMSVSLEVTDSAGATGTSAALDYVGVPAGTFRVANFRRVPDSPSVPSGTTVTFFATFADGSPDYSCELLPDGLTLLPTATTPATTEITVGSFIFATPGSFTSVLMARDSLGATDSPTLPIDVT